MKRQNNAESHQGKAIAMENKLRFFCFIVVVVCVCVRAWVRVCECERRNIFLTVIC